MFTRPEFSAVTRVHADAAIAARSGSTSARTFGVSIAGLSSHVVSVSRAAGGSAGRAAGAVVSAGETTKFEKLAPPRNPHNPTMPRTHDRLSDVTVSCGDAALSMKRRAV